MREQLGKPIPLPVVLGQVTETFREDVKAMAAREQIPICAFNHKERKDDVANRIRQERGVRDGVVLLAWRRKRRIPSKARRSMDSFYSRAIRPST
jgi:hypothetical protein